MKTAVVYPYDSQLYPRVVGVDFVSDNRNEEYTLRYELDEAQKMASDTIEWVMGEKIAGREQSDLRKELVEFIIQRSWECTNGVLSETLILDALEMATKYHNIVLARRPR